MSVLSFVRLGAVLGVLVISGSALGAPDEYRFEAVQPHVKAAGDAVVTVRLIHLPDAKPVADAVIFSRKMEMPMAGMAPMATKIDALKPTVPGEYPFQADLSMAGSWTLALQAKRTMARPARTSTV
jgi:hypothetical protein